MRIESTLSKRDIIAAGRRFGKTTYFEQKAALNSGTGKFVGWFCPSYKLMTPSYKAVKKLLGNAVAYASKNEMIIETVTGGKVEFWTLDDENAGRSRKYHLALIDEAGLVKKGLKDTWEQAIEPTLLDYNGDAIMAGTPKGINDENYFWLAWDQPKLGWRRHWAPTIANPAISIDAYNDLTKNKSPLVIQQEYRAEFVNWNGQNFFKTEWLLDEQFRPLQYPIICDYVFAVVDCAAKSGETNDGTAVTWFAMTNFPTPKLIVLDWEIVQIDGYFLKDVLPQWINHGRDLAGMCRARDGFIGAWIEDKSTGITLIQQGKNSGWPVYAIDSDMTSIGKESRAINISGYVAGGQVKISEFAYNKITTYKSQSKNHFLYQVLQFVIGEKDQADDLFDTFNYGVAIALGNSAGF